MEILNYCMAFKMLIFLRFWLRDIFGFTSDSLVTFVSPTTGLRLKYSTGFANTSGGMYKKKALFEAQAKPKS